MVCTKFSHPVCVAGAADGCHLGTQHFGDLDGKCAHASRGTLDQDLLAPLLEGMEQPPHPMAEGTSEKEYYAGEFDGAPGTRSEVAS